MLDVEPPRLRRGRASGAFVEKVRVWWNRHTTPYRSDASTSRFVATWSAVLSLIPGLGHLLMGYPRRAGLALGLWAAALAAAFLVSLPPTNPPALLADWLFRPHWLPLSVHAWIISDAYQLRLARSGRQAGWTEVLIVTMLSVALLLGPSWR